MLQRSKCIPILMKPNNSKLSKIIIFHHEFYFSGGAEHTLLETISSLEKNGFQVECYTGLLDIKNCFPERIRKYKIKQLLPHFSFIPRDMQIIIVTLLSPLLLLTLKADIYYGANQVGPLLAYVAALIHKKPYLVYMPYPQGFLYPRKIDQEFGVQHDASKIVSILVKIVKPIYKKIDLKIMNKAAAVMSEGSYATELFKKIYAREVINNPPGTTIISSEERISLNRFSGEICVNNIHIHKPYVLITNRHMPKKKFEYAVEIANKFSTDNSVQNIPFIITGSTTSYTNELRLLIQKYKINTIHFTGYTSEEDTTTLYKNAAVYIYTAPEEDFGKGIIQSYGQGVPVVAWNYAGPSGTILDGETGYLIEPYNIDTFSMKVKSLIIDQRINTLFANNAYSYAQKEYSQSKHNKVLIETIKQVINNS
jgi:glycosyltransferase involved in cell wall biosynthesis